MAGWTDSLSAGHLDNWETCKRVGLWGTPSNASGALAGDDLFLWKPLPQSGWLAHCRITGPAKKVVPGVDLPWREGPAYKWVMPIDVVAEAEGPLGLTKSEGALLAGLAHNVKVGQFAPLKPAGTARLAGLFHRSEVEEALAALLDVAGSEVDTDQDDRDWAQRLIALRRGQGSFRADLLRAFDGRCCITGCDVQAALEAAHIRPYRGVNSHSPGNGLLLRADLHTLFDLRLVTVMPYGSVRISPQLVGSEYEQFDERLISRPALEVHRPSGEALREHNASCDWLT